MPLLRFTDEQGHIYSGIRLTHDTAQVCSGDITSGFFPTSQTKTIHRLLAPLVPTTIFAVGFNYRDHVNETGFEKPRTPVLFMKATSSVTHPDAPIQIPACQLKGPETDYEGELAVIIGKEGKNISKNSAMDHVFGYTCANDVSARRWQKHGGGGQWIRSKSFDTFCPLGPAIAMRNEVKNIQNVSITTRLNQRIVQQSNTAKMIFPIPELIAFISQDTTLLPGTVILTGTPDGVGFAQDPMRFLTPGDTISITIASVGTLTNPVEAPSL